MLRCDYRMYLLVVVVVNGGGGVRRSTIAVEPEQDGIKIKMAVRRSCQSIMPDRSDPIRSLFAHYHCRRLVVPCAHKL